MKYLLGETMDEILIDSEFIKKTRNLSSRLAAHLVNFDIDPDFIPFACLVIFTDFALKNSIPTHEIHTIVNILFYDGIISAPND